MTAIGYFYFPSDTEHEGAVGSFESQPISEMELLLSFVHRCQVQIAQPILEQRVGNMWEWRGALSWSPQEGDTRGVSFLSGHRQLQDFLDRAFPIVADPVRGEASGLRLALHLFCHNFIDDTVEMHYLKTWIALEVLYTRYFGDEGILGSTEWRQLRNRMKATLKLAVAEQALTSDDYIAVTEKLGELNRPSTRLQVRRYLDDVLAPYPAQQVDDSDIDEFVTIRNQITHGGVMRRRSDVDYAEHLMREQGRLTSLVTRVILAVLGERPNLMEFSWRSYLAGA